MLYDSIISIFYNNVIHNNTNNTNSINSNITNSNSINSNITNSNSINSNTTNSNTTNTKQLFISPPFGNYFPSVIINELITKVQKTNVRTTSIVGSFTLEPRPGLLSQIAKTLRYSTEHQGWINKIGFRNKGLDWAIDKYRNDTTAIISVGIIDFKQVEQLNEKIPNDMNIEVNVSCPNVEKSDFNLSTINRFLNSEREWTIVKLSPLVSTAEIDSLYAAGWRQFHCSNTIPVSNGGLSGQSIMPYSLNTIKYIRDTYPDAYIIGGGGIKTKEDIHKYSKYGANSHAVSTVLFNPFTFVRLLFELSN